MFYFVFQILLLDFRENNVNTDKNIVLFLKFYKEGDDWIGDCEALGVMTHGDTIDEARESLEELIGLTLNAWEEAGERERLFKERGIVVYSGSWAQESLNCPALTPNSLIEMHTSQLSLVV